VSLTNIQTGSECPECGSDLCVVTNDPVAHMVEYDCFDCGYAGHDYYEDLYGCMSVPWGFLL
jgi:transposase-like protein